MISVCIATYNGEKYIMKQLESILCQLAPDDEVIVSDDGSQDTTLDIIYSLHDNRIKVYKNMEWHGVVPNFENAIKHASGDYIFLSDQDDVWAPNKAEVCIKALQSADLVVHDLLLMDGDGNLSDISFQSLRHSCPGYWKNLYKNSFMGSCMAFKGEVLQYVLPFPTHILWHDMWIGLMVEKKGKTKFIPDKLLYYRRHENNASPTSEKSSFSFIKKSTYRLQMLYYSLLR